MSKNNEYTNINTNTEQKGEKKKKGLIVFLVVLIIALAAALGFMAWQMMHAEPGQTAVIETDPNEELNSVDGTGQVRIKINPVITVKNDTMQNLNFCNYNEDRELQCKIKVGESYVYTSKKLKSSEILVGDFVKMEKLKKGKNEAIAEVYSFAPDSEELIGQTNVKIELNVE